MQNSYFINWIIVLNDALVSIKNVYKPAAPCPQKKDKSLKKNPTSVKFLWDLNYYFKSNRSRFITFVQAATKSYTNF